MVPSRRGCPGEMESTSIVETVSEAVAVTIRDHPGRVSAWTSGVPGSWGYLAGQAVLACRDRLGRTLTEAEQRAVWSVLWRTLTALAARQGP